MKFNIGNKVRYVGAGLPYSGCAGSDSDLTTGMVGVVVEVDDDPVFPYEVSFYEDKTLLWPMKEEEIERA